MRASTVLIQGIQFPVFSVNTLVVGSGAAALKASLSLWERSQNALAIVTEKWGGGTSNNSGSDKQTYYKLSLSGSAPDSPLEMAGDLFAGGCMHGDIALCEAQHSAQAFFELVQLGVPFPHDRYGGYPGYRTDHDPRGRATSAGPLTSRHMFEALAKRVRDHGIPIFDRHQVIALLVAQGQKRKSVIGAVALDLDGLESPGYGLVLFNAVNVILGTGGPGGLYEMSVYPEDQIGSIGIALQIGAIAQNLTESQFGLASLKHRWNVSGSYQQVIPRYVSTDMDGKGECDFLVEHFPDMGTMASAIFRKGYQWPFDPRRIAGFGSSLIDLAVYQETILRGRKAFLDFRHNPSPGGTLAEFDLSDVSSEAKEYLKRSHALQATPIERLARLNPRAIDLYRDHGIDLAREYLEIGVCAQHNNGGLRANHWWESNISHLFPVGEVNGTHGVYRPGGAALNAGQVGALRAAMYIARKYRSAPADVPQFVSDAQSQIAGMLERINRWLSVPRQAGQRTCTEYGHEIRQRMSRHGAQMRNPDEIRGAIENAWLAFKEIKSNSQIDDRREVPLAFRTVELALTHAVYLEAIGEYLDRGGKSRGSYLVLGRDGELSCGDIGDSWRFSMVESEAFVSRHILELEIDSDYRIHKSWVPVRPIPKVNDWFENVWKDYLDGKLFEETES
ncbi:MAG: FAD-binding protein [Acidobacteriia bacterium]|nr:FAD-binding protein [Terriglobia bacterium]